MNKKIIIDLIYKVRPREGGRLSTPPARRLEHRRPFFDRGHRGLMCGAAMTQASGHRGSEGTSPRPPLTESGIGALPYFAGVNEG